MKTLGVIIVACLITIVVIIYLVTSSEQQSPPDINHQQEPLASVNQTNPAESPKKDEYREAYNKALELLEKGDIFEARKEFSNAYKGRKTFSLEEKKYIVNQMILLNEKLLSSTDYMQDAETYTVKKGDTLIGIAKKYKVEAGMISFVNKIKNDAIWPNQKLKILKGKFHILIQKGQFSLQLMYNGSVVKEYKVAIGKENLTPVGKFTIGIKQKNPNWTFTDPNTHRKMVYKYGDPRNVLGDRWMGFEGDFSSFGIHGTSDARSIGTKASNGCIRMSNKDVKELYEIVPQGTEIEIID